MQPPGFHNILSNGIAEASSSPICTIKPVVNFRCSEVEQLYTRIGFLTRKRKTLYQLPYEWSVGTYVGEKLARCQAATIIALIDESTGVKSDTVSGSP